MYNNNMTLRGLLRNNKLAKVLPQFTQKMPLQNVHSFAEVDRRVRIYLKGLFGGTYLPNNAGIRVKGKHSEVLNKVKQAKSLIEQFFNAMPRVVKNVRANTKILLPYANMSEIGNIKSVDDKMQVMQEILDNINYNPNCNSLNSITNSSQKEFIKAQTSWAKKTGGQLAQ